MHLSEGESHSDRSGESQVEPTTARPLARLESARRILAAARCSRRWLSEPTKMGPELRRPMAKSMARATRGAGGIVTAPCYRLALPGRGLARGAGRGASRRLGRLRLDGFGL